MYEDFVKKLQMLHCTTKCPKKVSTCPVKLAIERHNRKNPESQIYWCAKCDGLFSGWRTVKKGKKTVKQALFTGGWIEFGGRTLQTRNYEFAAPCDCLCGEEAQKSGVSPYRFTDDRDICFQQRKRNRLDRSKNRKKQAQKAESPILATVDD